jgi:nucleoside-diphosphate-sugar epimerase
VRPFNVAGPGQRPEGGFVLPRFIAQAKANAPLTVYAPGTQRRAFTHVKDIVAGLVLVYQKGRRGEVYNLGNPANACDIRQLALEVIAATASHSNIQIVDPRDLWGPAFRDAPDKVPMAAKAHIELGWFPTRDRATTIADAIR